tara:strand:+ start:670 stop:819 length:150 start_codon:yes stop_codon:yes gene_type:complete
MKLKLKIQKSNDIAPTFFRKKKKIQIFNSPQKIIGYIFRNLLPEEHKVK